MTLPTWIDKLLDPQVILAIATLIGVLKSINKSSQNAKAIAENTEITAVNKEESKAQLSVLAKSQEVIHTLVNDMSTRGLGREAGQAERIADLTEEPGDKRAAIAARANYDEKKAVDAVAARQIESQKG